MTREELFAIWAPPVSPWSVWAKPVLFAGAPLTSTDRVGELQSIGALAYVRETALVVDMLGAESLLMGLALAQNGFRPVPLYNSAGAPGELVRMESIARLLAPGAAILKSAHVPADAPPAFLLNSDRLDGHTTLPGRYDNRWCLVPQDMPSAAFLMSQGVKRVAVVSDKIRTDLSHVLHRYQDAKLELGLVGDLEKGPQPLTVPKPASYRSLWYVMGVFAGLARNSAGGFGGVTPSANSSGSGFAG